MTVAEGNGPVNALDTALRKALIPVYPELEDMRLVDYKVRILTPQRRHQGGDAGDDREQPTAPARRWSTVGVSTNVIDASFNALHDASPASCGAPAREA